MIIPVIGIETLEDYKRKIVDGGFDDRPKPCPCCRKENSFWRHGSYTRRVIVAGEFETVRINRYMCGFCGVAVSCVFTFLVPYRQFLAKDVADAIEHISSSDTTYFALSIEVSDLEHETPRPSYSQIFRWIDAFSKTAAELVFRTQKEILLRNCNYVLEQFSIKCPAASRARSPQKELNLHCISEFIALAKQLVGDKVEDVHAFFLSEVETLQSIFSARLLRLPTPHRVQRLAF